MAALIPVLLSFTLLMVVTLYRSRKEVQKTLSRDVLDIKQRITEKIDLQLSYSYFLSRNVEFLNKGQTVVFRKDWNQITPIFNLKLFEVTYFEKVTMREFISEDYSIFTIAPETITNIWHTLSMPYYHRGFRQAFPEIISNTLVLRNTAIVYDYKKKYKTGLVIVSFPVDQAFLQEIKNEKDMIVFSVTSNGIVFSDEELNSSNILKKKIDKILLEEQDKYYSLTIPGRGRFYLYSTSLFSQDKKTLAQLGVLKGFSQVNEFFRLFRWVSFIVFVISAIFGVFFAIRRSNRITQPLVYLSKVVNSFQKSYKKIDAPRVIEDEIDSLHASFADMSDSILRYKETVDSYNSLLTREVEEKTKDLLNKVRSLSLINDFSSYILKLDTMEEDKFLEKSLQKMSELLGLCYISVYNMKSNNLERVYDLVRNKELNKKKTLHKLEHLSQRAAKKVFSQGDYVQYSYQSISIQACSVYFIDQIEYVLVYLGEFHKKHYIEDSFRTLSNLLSLSLYTMRINHEKIKSEKMASLGQFASTVIHDIKNPLGLIKGAIEILSDDDYSDKEKQEYSVIVNRELDMLISMLNDIMDFARGQISLVKESVEIDKLIKDIMKFYKKKTDESKIKVQLNLNSKLSMEIDRNRVWRALGNIISNAIDAMDPGGSLTIKTEKKMQDLMIMITDTGTGIPDWLAANIFEPFVTYGKKGGTGLGLAIVKRVVEAHGGNITFSSTRHQGTSFYIFLPF